MSIEIDDVNTQLAELKAERQNWEPLWQDVSDYVIPRRSFLISTIPQAKNQQPKTTIRPR